MSTRTLLAPCVLLATVPYVVAQTSQQTPNTGASSFDPVEATSGPENPWYSVHAELDLWQRRFGESWRIRYSKETQNARFLFGGSAPAAWKPSSDEDFFLLARAAIEETYGMHRIENTTLVEDGVMFLPLGNVGSTDKMTVRFRQEVDGVPVIHGYVNVLFDADGRLLSVDTTGLPEVAGLDTQPAYGPGEAAAAAAALFEEDTGLPPTAVTRPVLLVDKVKEGKFLQPRLVWEVDAEWTAAAHEAEGYYYRFDAKTGVLVSSETTIHHDVSGNVQSMATPGAGAGGTGNPEVSFAMPNMTVTSAQGSATTDENGDFTIVGASAPLDVTVSYSGTWAYSDNNAGSDYSLTTTLNSSSGNSVNMNAAPTEEVTAQANAFYWINEMRRITTSINPADTSQDFNAEANVNIAATCNATYSGSAVNFYASGGGCANTAYSSVVLHEMGHWMNDRYGSGNGSDGFGEGNADNFSTYYLDEPIIGIDFCGAGCFVRTGENTRQFCGDCCGGCYGAVHADGEVLMGAMWKIRTRLKNTHGVALGGAMANTLFNSWMNAYDDGQIQTIIEDHWLTLDDDDGNINNGTPNFADIDGGFMEQGFPGFELTYVQFLNVTELGNTTDEFGPYVVSADLTAPLNPPVADASLFYRVDGGPWSQVPMTLVSGDTYSGDIPGQQSPSRVEYYVSGMDSNGQTQTSPKGGANEPHKFIVGVVATLYSDNFESGAGGWTHGLNSNQDDWQLSSEQGATASFGKAGDPSTAPSGSNIWGNDLGPSGWNGFYMDDTDNWLRSPVFDLSASVGSTLRFQRWLNVESGQFDQASVKVNGVTVWTNPTTGDTNDTSWVEQEIDISFVDGNPSVQIEFSLVSDSGVNFGGWNIDDVEVINVSEVCSSTQSYCVAKQTSGGSTPTVGSTGTPSLAANDFVVTLTGAEPNKNGLVFFGPVKAANPFFGGTKCVANPVKRTPVQTTSGTGTASFAVAIDPAMVGTTRNYQWWFRDPADPFTVGLSDGLSVDFCD